MFFSVLDIAGINAWIIFRKTTGSRQSRRQFLRQLLAKLTEATTTLSTSSSSSTPAPATSASSAARHLNERVNCQVKAVCKRNNHDAVWQLQTTSLWPVYGERLQALPCVVCELLRRDTGVRQLMLAAVLGIHSLTGVRERSNKFWHLFFERLHKVKQSQFWGDI